MEIALANHREPLLILFQQQKNLPFFTPLFLFFVGYVDFDFKVQKTHYSHF